MEHPFAEGFVRNSLHPFFTFCSFPPGVTSAQKSVALFQTDATIFAGIRFAGFAFSPAVAAHVSSFTVAPVSCVCEFTSAENARIKIAVRQGTEQAYKKKIYSDYNTSFTESEIGIKTEYKWSAFFKYTRN